MATRIWTGETDGDPATATNWTDDTVPANGDTVIIPAGATVDIDGADQHTIEPTLLIIEEGCGINIGSRAAGVTTTWQINPVTVLTWGTGVIYLETDSVTLFAVYQAGTGAAAGQYKLNITGSTIAAMDVMCTSSAASIGIAPNGGDACTITNLRQTGGKLTLGLGVTLSTAVDASGGTLYAHCAIPTLRPGGGTVYHYGGSATLIEGSSGTVYYMNAVLCANVKLNGEAVIDMTKDLRERTFTNVEMGGESQFIDPYKTVALTNGIDICRVAQKGASSRGVTIDWGKHFTVKRETI